MPESTCRRCGAPNSAGGDVCPRCLVEEPTAVDAEAPLGIPGFTILGLLGAGGMGRVYRARQDALDRVVALKVLDPDLSRQAEFVQRFQREARALARLSHPGIVTLLHYGSQGGGCYLSMELVEGPDLRRLLEAGRLPPARALPIARRVAEALEYAHCQGVVHRDIKPSNILFDREERPRIADFGIAKLVGDGAGDALTGTHHVVGTMHYMAPEQAERSRSVDHRADVYSLGVVLYQMLTGGIPIGRFPAPSRVSPLDPRLDEVVLRCLEKDPSARYQRAGDLARDLEAIERETGAIESARTESIGTESRPASRRRALATLVRVLSLAAALLASGLLLLPPELRPLPPSIARALEGRRLRPGSDFVGGVLFHFGVQPDHTDLAIAVFEERLRSSGIDLDPDVTAVSPGRIVVLVPASSPEERARAVELLEESGALELRLAAPLEVEEEEWRTFQPLAHLPAAHPDRRDYELDLAENGRTEGERARGYAWYPIDPRDRRSERTHCLVALWEGAPERREVPVFRSSDIRELRLQHHPEGEPVFELEAGSRDDFEAATARHVGGRLAILVGGRVVSDPEIRDPVPGMGVIQGLGPDRARALVQAFRSGELPSRPELIGEEAVDPIASENLAGGVLLVLAFFVLLGSAAAVRSHGLAVPAANVLFAILFPALVALRGLDLAVWMLAALPFALALHLHVLDLGVRVPALAILVFLGGFGALSALAGWAANGVLLAGSSIGMFYAFAALASLLAYLLAARPVLARTGSAPRTSPWLRLGSTALLAAGGLLLAAFLPGVLAVPAAVAGILLAVAPVAALEVYSRRA